MSHRSGAARAARLQVTYKIVVKFAKIESNPAGLGDKACSGDKVPASSRGRVPLYQAHLPEEVQAGQRAGKINSDRT